MLHRIWLSIKILICYLLPFLPCCPQISELKEGDCVFTQAFGRNKFTDEELGRVIWQALSKSSSISETFSLLRFSGFDPGAPNRALANRTVWLAKRYKIPVIAQWEVVYAIWEMDLRWFLENQAEIDCLWPPQEGYYATWHVKLASKERMKARRKSRPIEICHPAMSARAISIIWKTRVDVIAEAVYPWNFWKSPLWTWDPNSVQPWTRGFVQLRDPREWWLARECFGRFIHHPFYRLVSFLPPP